MNDLPVSNIERQNVLNNRYALQAIQENLDVKGLRYHDELLFTTKMVADFYDVDERTIKRYVQNHGDELRDNGYFLSEGNSLKELKLHFVGDINVPKFTRRLGIFPFRAFLNIGMLLTESENAKNYAHGYLILLSQQSIVVPEVVPNTSTGATGIICLPQ